MNKKPTAIINKSLVSNDDKLFYCENPSALKVLLRIAEEKYDPKHSNITSFIKLFMIRTHLKNSLEVGVIVNLTEQANPCNNSVRIENFTVKKKELDRLIALEEVGMG